MSINKKEAYAKIAPMMAAAGIAQAANRPLATEYANLIYRSKEGDQTNILTEIAEDMARRTCDEQLVDFGDGRGVVVHKMPGNLPSFADMRGKVLFAADC